MALKSFTKEACESIDASVFNGELLFDEESVAALEEYIGRWQRAIAEQRQTGTNENTFFLSYAELTSKTNVMVDMLIQMAATEANVTAVEAHLTQCTALLSMWGHLVSPLGFARYPKDHELLANKIVAAAERMS